MSLTYPGGFITKNPTAPTVNAAPGVWTLDQALQYIKAGTWPQPLVGDPYWQYTALLSGTGSTNGAQNNTFIDSSSNNFTITRNGNTTQGTFTPFTAPNGYWGNYFNATNLDNISFANGSNFAFGTGDYTIEFWINGPLNSDRLILDFRSGGSGNGFAIVTGSGSGNTAGCLRYSGANDATSGSIVITNNQWNHCAIVRASGTIKLYVNGVYVGTCSDSSNYSSTSGTIYIGRSSYSTSYNLTAYLSNFRIVKGTALYTTDFTPSTTPLTSVSGTSLLTCQSNRFVDNSGNSVSLTISGSPSVVPFAPFGNTTAYSASTVGGSGYFDGTGDYLTVANNANLQFGTGDFTVECWCYVNNLLSTQTTLFSIGRYDAGILLRIAGGSNDELYINGSSYAVPFSTYMQPYAWSHIAITRSGSTVRVFVNGSVALTTTNSANISQSTATTIGAATHDTTQDMNGYISGVRILKGTAQYTGAFSLPTSPPTAITNTQLLINFTNAGIYDQAAKNDMETVGNAQVSTSVVKYGNGSMYFDGTGDYLTLANLLNTNLGSGPFTIELWAYFNSTSGTQFILSNYQSSTVGYGLGLSSGVISFWATGDTPDISSGFTPTTGIWYHIAVSGQSGAIKLFINGTQYGSTFTGTPALDSTATLRIGDGQGAASPQPFNGYLSDIRITKGLARYPYNFTPPAKSLPNFYQAQTLTADPYFDYTTLLLPGTGTNGAQNNTFLDSSTNAFSITRNGNTTQGTFSPFSQTGWSNYFDGSGDYLGGIGTTSSFNFMHNTTALFTAECWVYVNNLSSIITLFDNNNSTSSQIGVTTQIYTNGTVNLFITYGSTGNNIANITTTGIVPTNQWTHIAFVYDQSAASNNGQIYINGVLAGSGNKSGNTPSSSNASNAMRIGCYGNGTAQFMNGYISNFRITNSKVYTTAFTPPTTPLTAIANTALLTCQSNRFIDNSTNAFSITVNGNTSVQAFSPFAPSIAYSTITNGGSGYFDGTTDYLSVPNNTALNLSSGDWTIEFWTYVPSGVTSTIFLNKDGVYGSKQPQYDIELNSSRLYARIGDSSGAGTFAVIWPATTFPYNQWVHVEFVKSGSTIYLFQNGVSMGTASTIAMVDSGNPLYIGTESGSPTTMNGYISGLRILKGTAAHITGFTPPTAPPTNITNTSLLLNFTNAGITDATAKNDLETFGNAQISNTTAKWGSTSIKFDGTGDYLIYPDNVNWAFGAGDFTIEGWIYNAGTNGFIIAQTDNSTAAGSSIVLYLTSGALNALMYYGGSSFVSITDASTFPTNQWVHIALTRYGGTATLFVNGISRGTASLSTNSINDVGSAISIGARTTGGDPFTGYIQDFRITKGIARYTQNFTPPTAAFQLL